MNMVIKPEHPSTQLWLLVANFTLHWWDKGPPSHGKRSLGRSTPVTSWDYGANFDKKASTMRDLYGFKGRMRLGLTGWLAHPIFRHTQISFLSFAISRRHQARLSCLRGASKGAPRPKLHKPAWGGARGDGFMARMMYIYNKLYKYNHGIWKSQKLGNIIQSSTPYKYGEIDSQVENPLFAGLTMGSGREGDVADWGNGEGIFYIFFWQKDRKVNSYFR